ncbi:MAG: MotA/TolQ/ExbB proton channel family protein [bacterium]
MIPIGLCSILSLAFTAERAWYLWSQDISASTFWDRLEEPLSSYDFQTVLERTRSFNGLLSELVQRGLSVTPLNRDRAVDEMEEYGLEKMPELERFLPALNFIAQVSPLLGLLGTVAGMIETFSVIAEVGVGRPEMLAGGISKALITTASGLAVGIITLFFHHLLSRRVDRITHEMEMGVRRIDEVLKNEPGSGNVQDVR